MRKIITAIMIILVLASLASCGCSSKNSALPKGATEDEANYPKKTKDTAVVNDNETGKTYNYTLNSYTTEFNTMYEKLGGDYKDFPFKKWKKESSEKQPNGKVYNFYYLAGKEVVLTATEEDESKLLVNVGCGITVKKFNKNNSEKTKVMTICGIMAASSGGYSSKDVSFFGNLFVDTISSDDHNFWYDGSIYIYDKETSSKGKDTILFRTMPADEKIKKDWNIKDYRDYWFENK